MFNSCNAQYTCVFARRGKLAAHIDFRLCELSCQHLPTKAVIDANNTATTQTTTLDAGGTQMPSIWWWSRWRSSNWWLCRWCDLAATSFCVPRNVASDIDVRQHIASVRLSNLLPMQLSVWMPGLKAPFLHWATSRLLLKLNSWNVTYHFLCDHLSDPPRFITCWCFEGTCNHSVGR